MMTQAEICRSFLQAKNRQRHIKVLAELTLQPKEQIKKILLANGLDPEQPAPKYQSVSTDAAGSEVMLPAYIRKEVLHYVNKGYRIRRHQRNAGWSN